ncbi:MAG: phage major capsid protein [Hyphomonadaceae bacterium]|nr:phage major capsid protein [Hyphomonadaceae bacterium]
MNRAELMARMSVLVSTATAEGRELNAQEIAEFDSLKAKTDLIDISDTDKMQARRDEVSARRSQGPGTTSQHQVPIGSAAIERLERHALAPNESLAARHPRQTGDTTDWNDYVRAQLGIGNMRAEQVMNTGFKGGFLVSDSLSSELIDLARAKAQTIQAGARTLVAGPGETQFTRVTKDPEFSQHLELEDLAETSAEFGAYFSKPKTIGAMFMASVELIEDSPNFSAQLMSTAARAFAVQIDRLGLYGNGLSQQTGILNQDGVHEISGAGLSNWSPLSRAYQAVRQSNYEPGAFVTSPGVVGQLDGLVDTTGQPLNRPPSLRDTGFLDTTSIVDAASPANSAAVTGQWNQLFYLVRTGITMEASRTAGDAFKKLGVMIRLYARLDSFAISPAAFCKVSNIPTPAI